MLDLVGSNTTTIDINTTTVSTPVCTGTLAYPNLPGSR
jgi:hypothetical protein